MWKMAKHYRIHPAVGFARVGSSSEDFPGPELPGTYATPADGLFRDASGQLRRQSVRFRVFEYDDANPAIPPVEVVAGSPGVALVEWTVHLANKKAIWHEFDGVKGEERPYPPNDLRNPAIRDATERRRQLIIDPGARSISGSGQRKEIEKTPGSASETWPGLFTGNGEIKSLGTLFTDEAGRLKVAGGYGISGTTGPLPANRRLHYANNDAWFDDISDGPVTAAIHLASGETI